MLFKHASTNKGGYQAIGNRLTEVFNLIGLPFDLSETNDTKRKRLKTCFQFQNLPTMALEPHLT